VSGATLERWRGQALAKPFAQRTWTAAARLEALVATAALDEAARGAWCRAHGVYPKQMQQWRDGATQALADPEQAPASPQQTEHDRRRIKETKREVRRKDRAQAEAAALLVLSKKSRRSSTEHAGSARSRAAPRIEAGAPLSSDGVRSASQSA